MINYFSNDPDRSDLHYAGSKTNQAHSVIRHTSVTYSIALLESQPHQTSTQGTTPKSTKRYSTYTPKNDKFSCRCNTENYRKREICKTVGHKCGECSTMSSAGSQPVCARKKLVIRNAGKGSCLVIEEVRFF